jgi:hypothetical protein
VRNDSIRGYFFGERFNLRKAQSFKSLGVNNGCDDFIFSKSFVRIFQTSLKNTPRIILLFLLIVDITDLRLYFYHPFSSSHLL